MSECRETPLELIRNSSDLYFDLFICSSSFESRSTTIAREISDFKYKLALICHYSNNYKVADANLLTLQGYLKNNETVSFQKDSPIHNLDNLLTAIYRLRDKEHIQECRILLDISTFTHEMIMILVFLFKKHLTPPDFILTIIYNSAQDYSILEKAVADKWLSKGVGEIRTVLGYPGELIPSKKNLLIVFVGYEVERVKSIIELFGPNLVLLGHASTQGAISDSLLEKNKLTYQELESTLYDSLGIDIIRFEFTCRVPDEVVSILDKLVYVYGGEYNIVIASLNNKISTIGCALAGLKHQELQICYPTAIQYNYLNYSKPSENAFIIKF